MLVDILERLKPSLEKYIGCDIVDVNPGVGIWSSSIHEYLQPRTHILLEPDRGLYEPILKPLLDAPNSKYVFIPKSGVVWGHLEKVLSKQYLPEQDPLTQGDPRLEQPNNTLLFIANLGYHPRKLFAGFPSLTTLVLHQLLSSVQTNSLFQRYGLVRMLIWVGDDERRTILPKTVTFRRKSSIEAEIACESITEVASSTKPLTLWRRAEELDIKTANKVVKKMKDSGIVTPEQRQSLELEEVLETEAKDVDEPEEQALKYRYEKDLLELEAAVGPKGELGGTREDLQRLRDLQYRKRADDKRADRLLHVCNEYDKIVELQKELYNASDKEKVVLVKKELDERCQLWTNTFDDLPEEYQANVQHAVDDRQCADLPEPTLLWDRRLYEPLKVYPEDFFPTYEMALLDFQPRATWPIFRENKQEHLEIFEYMTSQLLILPTQSIKRGFTALWPGVFEWLIAECPSITNPNKGGNMNPELMTVRRLTQDMLKEMVEAWVRWPLKPTRFELMARMGSGTYDPDGVEVDD